ncbi:MAG: hypothetical protein IK127_05400 [Clostridia bacterium]|nr:hypothetical protein [Clostridia bacterium]
MRHNDYKDGLHLSLPDRKKEKQHIHLLIIPSIILVITSVLLLLIPEARYGTEALCNRLFDASEAVNRYAYTRFSVSASQTSGLAIIFLAIMGISWIAIVFACPSCLPALLTAVGLSAGQAYLGLALPWWALIPIYGMLAIRMMRGLKTQSIMAFCLMVLILTAGILLAWPGVDEATEAASERVRDALGHPAAASADGVGAAEETAIRETRHVNSQSLLEGSGEAEPDQSYRLVTVEEQQISMPRWVDYVKIGLLLLLAIAALVLPFLPFAAMNARRKKALETRAAFDAEDNSTAICAMFRHVMRYLNTAGNEPNLLFSGAVENLSNSLPETYRNRCRACVSIFEEAAYSDHPLPASAREQVRDLLNETEALLYDKAGLRQRLRLRYGECLHL